MKHIKSTQKAINAHARYILQIKFNDFQRFLLRFSRTIKLQKNCSFISVSAFGAFCTNELYPAIKETVWSNSNVRTLQNQQRKLPKVKSRCVNDCKLARKLTKHHRHKLATACYHNVYGLSADSLGPDCHNVSWRCITIFFKQSNNSGICYS